MKMNSPCLGCDCESLEFCYAPQEEEVQDDLLGSSTEDDTFVAQMVGHLVSSSTQEA